MFHVDGRTDMTKLIDAFRCFANANQLIPSHTDMYNVHARSTKAVLSYHLSIPVIPSGSSTSILNKFIAL